MIMQTTIQKRLPRYERAKTVNFRLQDRDIEIIKEVYKYRFLNSDHISALVEGGRQGILRRLNLLFHAGYLDRPKAQRQIKNQKMVYGLGNRGAELLASEFDRDLSLADWTTKNREAGMVFLSHTLMVANFIVMVRAACRTLKGLRYIEPESIINQRPQPARGTEQATSWKIEVQDEHRRRTIGIIPDYVFGIYDELAGRTFYYFLEADRSTMPIKRSVYGKSSFYKKLVGYYETCRQGQLPAIWGFKAVRILTLTVSKDRLLSMINANRSLGGNGRGSNIFLFASESNFELDEPSQVFNRIWTDGEGQKVSPLDSRDRRAIINERGELTFFSAE